MLARHGCDMSSQERCYIDGAITGSELKERVVESRLTIGLYYNTSRSNVDPIGCVSENAWPVVDEG